MAAGTQSRAEVDAPESVDRPEVSVCEGAPGTSVFIESGNSDGWIASDTTIEVTE